MPKSVKICPKCRSAKVHLLTNVSGWLAPQKFICMECGHSGPFFIDVDLEDLKKE